MNAPKKLILQAGNFYFHLIAKVFMQHSKFVPKIFLVRQQSFLFCHKSKRCATGPKSKDFGITLWAIKQNQAQSPDSALDLNWITWCAPLFFPSRLLGLLIKRIQFQNFSFREFNNPATRQIRNIYGGGWEYLPHWGQEATQFMAGEWSGKCRGVAFWICNFNLKTIN